VSLRNVAALVLVALVAGAIAAQADSGSAPRPARAPVRATPPPSKLGPSVARLVAGCAVPVPVPVPPGPRRPVPQPAPQSSPAAPPSKALLDAFAILRRERRAEDALSPQALEALRVRGLLPVSKESARLLRSTPSGGRAWVVPVPDLLRSFPFACGPGGKSGPREGLVVVAVGDAASGGGGALDQLVRGLSPVTVVPCAGADESMLSISGTVPDGVPAVFLTAPDGTAVRTDVKDNGYEFLLPRQRRVEQRYVVWTGGDGTPHVQGVVTYGPWRPSRCEAAMTNSMARVSPDAAFLCLAPQVLSPAVPSAPARRAPRLARRGPLSAKFLYVPRCWPASAVPTAVVVPGRPIPPAVVVPGRPLPPSAVPARPVRPPAVPPPVRKPR
jgi:hypothetical protein